MKKKRSRSVTFRIDEDKFDKLEAYAKSCKTSISEVLRECADCDTKFNLSQDMKERLTKIAASKKRYTVGKLTENAVKQVEACKTKMAFRVRGSELSLDALKPISRIIKRHVHNLLVHFK